MLLKDIEHIQKVNDKKVKVLQLIKTYKLYNICFMYLGGKKMGKKLHDSTYYIHALPCSPIFYHHYLIL